MAGRLANAAASFRLDLGDVTDALTLRPLDAHTLAGYAPGAYSPTAVFVRRAGGVVGHMRWLRGETDRMDAVLDLVDGSQQLRVFCHGRLEHEGVTVAPSLPEFPPPPSVTGTQVEVFFAYTRDAAEPLGPDAESLCVLFLAELNAALDASGIETVRFRLAAVVPTSYEPPDTLCVTASDGSARTYEGLEACFEHVASAEASQDEAVQTLHRQGREHQADIVVLLVGHPSSRNGVAPVMHDAPCQQAGRAIAVVQARAALTNYTVAHELGHLLGCGHAYGDRSREAPCSGVAANEHVARALGIRAPDLPGGVFATLMSTEPWRQLVFSCGARNPAWIPAAYAGRDNALVVQRNAPRVARFAEQLSRADPRGTNGPGA